jgi:tRNA A37 N6-isopentenylltransferase MiaA
VIGGEGIIADKIQMYTGLDIATNNNQPNDQGGISHLLTGVIPLIVDDLIAPSLNTVSITTIDLYLSLENRCCLYPVWSSLSSHST